MSTSCDLRLLLRPRTPQAGVEGPQQQSHLPFSGAGVGSECLFLLDEIEILLKEFYRSLRGKQTQRSPREPQSPPHTSVCGFAVAP